MDYRSRNISALTEYFASGCKKERLLGLELEHFVVDRKTQASLPYENGVEELLKRLQPKYGEPILSQGRIIGIMREGAVITLEPAAQLEISIGPAKSIRDMARIYDEFLSLLTPILCDMGCVLKCVGYHPKSRVDELSLIPKKRYEYMDAYFKNTGTHGKNMMKGSAATQVSIDYESEADFSKKFRVANVLGPLFAFICDNTVAFEGKPFPGRMARTSIWNDVDPDRSMVVRGSLDGEFGFSDYAEYIYDMPPILIEEDGEQIFTGRAPVSEIFTETLLTRADIEHVISMAFPDVRLKTYIEIRMADSIPIEYALAYTALLKGMFYNEKSLETLFELTSGIGNNDVQAAKAALTEKGAGAVVYEKSAREWLRKINELAQDGLTEEDREFFRPLGRLLSGSNTFAKRYRHEKFEQKVCGARS